MKMHTLLLIVGLLSPAFAQADLKLQSTGKDKNFLYDFDPKALSTHVFFVFRNGSLGDPKGKEGLTRLSISALLRGTATKSHIEFVSAVEQMGAAIEVDPGISRSILSLNTLSENLVPAVDLLAEAIMHPGLRAEEISELKEEELARLNQEMSSNRSVMKRTFRQALYAGTPMAFPAEGTIDGIKASSVDDIKAVLAKSVTIGNVLIAASSNKPEAEVKAILEKAFAELPKGPRVAPPKMNFHPIKGRTLFLVNRKGSSTTEVSVGHFGIKADDRDREALETGMFVFGSDFTSRVPNVLRKEHGWTYGAYASYQLLDLPRKNGGAFLLYSFPRAEYTEQLVPKAVELMEDYAKNGVTDKELTYAKNSLENSYAFKFADSESRVMGQLYQALDNAPRPSVPEYRKIVGALTKKQILKAIHRVHDPKNMIFVLVGDPERTKNMAKLIPGIVKTVTVEDPMKEF